MHAVSRLYEGGRVGWKRLHDCKRGHEWVTVCSEVYGNVFDLRRETLSDWMLVIG